MIYTIQSWTDSATGVFRTKSFVYCTSVKRGLFQLPHFPDAYTLFQQSSTSGSLFILRSLLYRSTQLDIGSIDEFSAGSRIFHGIEQRGLKDYSMSIIRGSWTTHAWTICRSSAWTSSVWGPCGLGWTPAKGVINDTYVGILQEITRVNMGSDNFLKKCFLCNRSVADLGGPDPEPQTLRCD